jgi:ketosteroid isomerase-like protein
MLPPSSAIHRSKNRPSSGIHLAGIPLADNLDGAQEVKVRKLAMCAVALTFAVGTSKSGVPAQGTKKTKVESLQQLEGAFMKEALEKGTTGYMSYYSDDATELPNGADAIVGKANIAKGMGFLDDKNNRLTWSPVSGVIADSGDLGYSWGIFEFRSKDKGGTERVEHGKYLTIWKKQADGSWKVAVDMGNSGPMQK